MPLQVGHGGTEGQVLAWALRVRGQSGPEKTGLGLPRCLAGLLLPGQSCEEEEEMFFFYNWKK